MYILVVYMLNLAPAIATPKLYATRKLCETDKVTQLLTARTAKYACIPVKL